jgi:hypothetical protein
VFDRTLTQERDLLENLVSWADPAGQSDRYRYWNAHTQLVSCLRDRGPAEANPADYDLTQPGVVDALLRLGVAVPVVEVTAVGASTAARQAKEGQGKAEA